MKFDKEVLQELVWLDEGDEFSEELSEKAEYEVVKNEIVESSRWSIHSVLVFKHGEKFYEVPYSTGATEQQDERPFEYDGDMIDCKEVEPYEVSIIKYRKAAK